MAFGNRKTPWTLRSAFDHRPPTQHLFVCIIGCKIEIMGSLMFKTGFAPNAVRPFANAVRAFGRFGLFGRSTLRSVLMCSGSLCGNTHFHHMLCSDRDCICVLCSSLGPTRIGCVRMFCSEVVSFGCAVRLIGVLFCMVVCAFMFVNASLCAAF